MALAHNVFSHCVQWEAPKIKGYSLVSPDKHSRKSVSESLSEGLPRSRRTLIWISWPGEDGVKVAILCRVLCGLPGLDVTDESTDFVIIEATAPHHPCPCSTLESHAPA